ncbi:MAG: hypothetical protein ACREQB_09375, partial [Candidatus Binataceae bacterium]
MSSSVTSRASCILALLALQIESPDNDPQQLGFAQMSIRHFAAPPLAIVIVLLVAGCISNQIEESRRQIEAQQALIEKQGRDIEQLQSLQTATRRTPVAALGSCDPSVRDLATSKGGERFAANDFQQALGYYEDALVACPNSPRAEFNVARTYE